MTQAVDLVQPDLVEDDDDEVHLTCCDDNVAMCGLNLEQHDWIWDSGEDDDCVMCAYVCDNNLPCPVPGCNRAEEY